jgi:hypothetical protein
MRNTILNRIAENIAISLPLLAPSSIILSRKNDKSSKIKVSAKNNMV